MLGDLRGTELDDLSPFAKVEANRRCSQVDGEALQEPVRQRAHRPRATKKPSVETEGSRMRGH